MKMISFREFLREAEEKVQPKDVGELRQIIIEHH